MDSRSRWFVGSSSTSTFGFCSMSLQKIRRAASPPDKASVGFIPSSRMKSIWPSKSAQFFGPRGGIVRLQPIENRQAGLNRGAVVLRKETDRNLVAPFDGTAVDAERLIHRPGSVGDQTSAAALSCPRRCARAGRFSRRATRWR